MIKNIAIYSLLGLLTVAGFQNCSQVAFTDAMPAANALKGADATNEPTGSQGTTSPSNPLVGASLSLVSDSTAVLDGQNAVVTINFENASNVQYSCVDKVTGQVVQSAQVTKNGQKVPVRISGDIHCEATANANSDKNPLVDQKDITVNCGNRLKNSALNRCEDFTCKKVLPLDRASLSNVPKRTIEGLCYALKIFDRIENGKSSLTMGSDSNVIARSHDLASTTATAHPYAMNIENTELRLEGPRVVKLSGGLSATASILVDNFVLVGVHPSNVDPNNKLNDYYKAMGTADSSIVNSDGSDTHSIQLNQTLIPVQAFGPRGTSTVAPLDITSSIQPEVFHRLDVRALDCGGSRQLSDIYLLFQ